MSELVDPSEIEGIVGATRHPTQHHARAVSEDETVYILHSARCRERTPDLRDCLFSVALDGGIDVAEWEGCLDRSVRVTINRSQRLIPSRPGMKVSA